MASPTISDKASDETFQLEVLFKNKLNHISIVYTIPDCD